jgi:hypothetical protein
MDKTPLVNAIKLFFCPSPTLPINIRTDRKGFTETNTPAYLTPMSVGKKKVFIELTPLVNVIKLLSTLAWPYQSMNGFTETNTPAYVTPKSEGKKKVFMELTPLVNVIELLSTLA